MKKLDLIRIGIAMSLIVGCNFITKAQSPLTFTKAMDSLLAPLDKNRIPTGILYERVKPFADIDLFNAPLPDPLVSDYDYYTQAYFELYHAAYNKTGWLKPEHLQAFAEGEVVKSNYNMGVLDYQFNMIDSNAVNNGQLTFSNGQFHDVPGASSPYWTKRLQMAAILSDEIPGGHVSLMYNPDFIKTNLSLPISSIQLDFGSTGVFTLSPANPVVQLNFTESGIKEFTVTVQYTNGSSFTHTSDIQIGSSQTYGGRVEGNTAELPDASFWMSSKYPYKGYGESQPSYAKAKISIWWKRNAQNQPVPGLKKPMIIVDGFDPNGGRKDTSIYKLFVYDTSIIVNGQTVTQKLNFADELRKQGFDIIVMDMPGYTKDYPGTINDPASSLPYPKPLFDDVAPDTLKGVIFGGGDFQQRNAYILEGLMDYCNQQMLANGSNEKLVVIGPSMGGQITRYALRDMEIRGQDHNCRLWVCFDSHNQGSYAPMGLQYSLNDLAGAEDDAAFFKSIFLDCPEAKQSLLHHYSTISETVKPADGYFSEYYNQVNSPAFGFPQATGLRKIAMISGSDLGVPQTFGTACQLATKLEARYKPRGFLAWATTILTGGIGYAISPFQTQKTYLAPASGQCTIFKYGDLFAPEYSRKIYAPAWCGTSLDMVQGGHFPSFKIYKNEIDGKRPKKWYKDFVKISVEDYIGSQVQQLTYSTLAVGLGSMPNPNRKWDENFRRDASGQAMDVTCPETKESPFDMYWAPDINTRHDSLLLGHVIRLRKEIIDKQPWPRTQIPRTVNITSNVIYVCPGNTITFTITNPLPGMVYNWVPSHPFLNVISGQGTTSVVVRNNGTINDKVTGTVTCQASSDCYIIASTSPTFKVGPLANADFNLSGNNGSPYFCLNQTVTYSISGVAPGSNYVWSAPAGWTTLHNGGSYAVFRTQPGTYPPTGSVSVSFTEPCGTAIITKSTSVAYNSSVCTPNSPYTISPNPAVNSITIACASLQSYCNIAAVQITNLYGLVLSSQSWSFTNQQVQMPVYFLQNGTYVAKIYNGTQWFSVPFVVQH